MKTKTLTLKHYDQTFKLKMIDGSKYEITIKKRDRIGTNFSDEPYIWGNSPEELLERWIESGSVVDGLNLSHVVKFTSGETSNEREEQVTYKKHWWWGWRKDTTWSPVIPKSDNANKHKTRPDGIANNEND